MSFGIEGKNGELSMTECCCPTCGAVQTWRDECRRCRTDIRFLRQLSEKYFFLQNRFFEAFRNEDWQLAELLIKQLQQISPIPFYHVLSRFLNTKLTNPKEE